jgi:hypothetical protein
MALDGLDGSDERGRQRCQNRAEVGFNALEMRISMREGQLVIDEIR